MGSMRKEMAVGFSVITVLLLVLGLLVYRRATAMWQTPDANDVAATPVKPIVPIDGRPRIVVAQDNPPADQPLDDQRRDPDGETVNAEQPYTPPADRRERLHSSFLPRQFEQADSDPASSTSSPGDASIGDQDQANVESDPGQAPPDAGTALTEPLGGRQTSLEVADGDFAAAGRDRQPLDAQPSDGDLPDDSAAMTPDPSQDRNRQDWPASADRDPAEGLPTSGSLPAEVASDTAYNQDGIPDRSTDGLREFERREGFAGGRDRQFGRSNQEPERVAIENGKYIVAPNDNYWIIAEKVYGNGAYFKALFEHNRSRHPRSDKLQVGDVLDAPPAATLADRYPDICPRPRKVPNARQTLQPASTRHHAGERVYVVGEGDTLFDIARHELGRAARWTEIYDLNRDVLGEDFDYLRPGTELVLPRDRRGDPDSVTRKDDPVYQR